MTIEIAIKTYLLTKTALTNIVGQRIYYATVPQTPTYPAISFFRVSNYRHHDIDVASPRFQFDVWSMTYIQSVEISNEIRLALQREKRTISGIEMIQGVYLNETDMYENDTKIYHTAMDFKIIYKGE